MTPSLVRSLLAATVATMLAGCDGVTGPDPELRITPDRAAYSPGSTTTLTVHNLGDEPVFYNLCPSVIERRVGGRWVEVNFQPFEMCSAELRTLEPGAQDTEPVELPPNADAGTYRVYFPYITLERGGETLPKERKASEPFAVQSAMLALKSR